MSIWASDASIGFDQFDDEPQVGEVRSYATGWSNHYPTTDGEVERPALIDTAHLPPWCVPGHDDVDTYDGQIGPWLRLGVSGWQHNYFKPSEVIGEVDVQVVLDVEAVRALHSHLTWWLEQEKVYPIVSGCGGPDASSAAGQGDAAASPTPADPYMPTCSLCGQRHYGGCG